MDAGSVAKIERNIQRGASAIFAGAAGFAAYVYLSAHLGQPLLGAEAGGAAALAYVLCGSALGAVRPEPRGFPEPIFDLRKIEPAETDELVLTDADRLQPGPISDDSLLLEDVLADIGPDSRVVRLFDPAAMPTPGQLKARIDQHLNGGTAHSSRDASQALYDALAELRMELR